MQWIVTFRSVPHLAHVSKDICHIRAVVATDLLSCGAWCTLETGLFYLGIKTKEVGSSVKKVWRNLQINLQSRGE